MYRGLWDCSFLREAFMTHIGGIDEYLQDPAFISATIKFQVYFHVQEFVTKHKL